MKRFFIFFSLAMVFASCTFYNVEPRYDERDRIVGYYDVEEYSETYNDITYYAMRISKSGSGREILFSNFYAADIRIYAQLDFDKIRIPFQVVDGYEVEGVGTVLNNEISLNYRVKDRFNNTVSDFCETRAFRDF